MESPRLLTFPTYRDPTGNLTVPTGVPFEVQRTFFLHDLVGGARRGGHAHHVLQEVIVALSGSFDVVTVTGSGRRHWTLNRADKGLFVPPACWRDLRNFSGNAIALVLASTPYDPDDYIRTMDEFLACLPTPIAGYSERRARAAALEDLQRTE